MKKAMGIIILGLLFSNVGVAGNGVPKIDETTWEIQNTKGNIYSYEIFFQSSGQCNYKYTSYPEYPEKITGKWKGKCKWTQNGNQLHWNINNATDRYGTLNGKKMVGTYKVNYNPDFVGKFTASTQEVTAWIVQPQEEKKLELASMIDKAKSTCKDLGFEEGTEKFSDCSLKLYSQSVELAAKQNQQVVIQTQGNTSSSGSNVMTIYDPVRDSNALIKRGQGLINGTCTLGDLSNC